MLQNHLRKAALESKFDGRRDGKSYAVDTRPISNKKGFGPPTGNGSTRCKLGPMTAGHSKRPPAPVAGRRGKKAPFSPGGAFPFCAPDALRSPDRAYLSVESHDSATGVQTSPAVSTTGLRYEVVVDELLKSPWRKRQGRFKAVGAGNAIRCASRAYN